MIFETTIFRIPFSQSTAIYAKPYSSFSEGFHFGFSDLETKISIRQTPRESIFVSPPDHSFVLDIAVENITNTKWITLERKLDRSAFFSGARLTVLISLRSSVLANFHVDLRLHNTSGKKTDLPLGGITLGQVNEYRSETLSLSLSEFPDVTIDDLDFAELIVHFPLEQGLSVTLAMFNVFITRSGVIE